jgi:cytochrome P450
VAVDTTIAWPVWEDPAFYAQELDVIHASMAAQRLGAPVDWYEPGRFWVLSKWADVRYVGSHPQLFSSRSGVFIGDAGDPKDAIAQLPQWALDELSQPGLTAAKKRGIVSRGKLARAYRKLPNSDNLHMIILDPPRHQEVRRVLTQALSPKLVRSLGTLIAEATDELLDEITPGEVIDVVPVVGGIPAALIASLLGVPRDMHRQFGVWAEATMSLSALPTDAAPERVAALRSEVNRLMAYATELIEERKAAKARGDDLISAFLRSELDGAPLTPEMMITYMTAVISAGSDTTKNLLSFLVHALAERPDQRDLLTQRPELIPNAVEETLRYFPIIWAEGRTATQATVLRDKEIQEDDYVIQVYASANRDEEIFENPNDYDVTRAMPFRHVGFGWGEHVCPGSTLVRKDAPIVLQRILHRFASWEPAGTPERHTSLLFNGLRSLPITFVER